jgi:hypothetical protein
MYVSSLGETPLSELTEQIKTPRNSTIVSSSRPLTPRAMPALLWNSEYEFRFRAS